jgi:hypothetical protein
MRRSIAATSRPCWRPRRSLRLADGRDPLALHEGDAFTLADGEAHRGRAGADGVRLFLIDRAG